jgi:RNA polymerase sigma-70 factor (ECF subfamily)
MREAAPSQSTQSSVPAVTNSTAAIGQAPGGDESTRAQTQRPSSQSAALKEQSIAEDRMLIRRAQHGDASAFNDIIVKYEKLVFNFAYRLTQNYDDAHDVAQDAFIRAYNALNTFRGDAAFSTWIFRIITNVFLDDRKRKKAHPVQSIDEHSSPDDDQASMQVVDPGPTPEEIVAARERQALLAKAIRSLPDFQRTMVVLYHLEHKSYEEIADIVGLPLGTVKSRLNRSRLALKEKLQGMTEHFPS